jgi:hypothetical protein
MLFKRELWDGLADGSVTLAFRRWRAPRARVGARHRIPGGMLAIDAVDVVQPDDVDERDARRAGFADRAAFLRAASGAGDLYRIRFHFAGADPRTALRQRAAVDAEERAELTRRLQRFDAASPHGAWTMRVLRLIEAQPARRAAELAAQLGRDTPSFKIDVRKLKALGLTESLEVGYRLSPRGRAFLE